MKIIGLTGSIGMGKSTVAAMLRDLGVPVFDADAVVHQLQGPGGPLVALIESAFPGTTSEAGVDRQKLGALVFNDNDAMERLESIVHPAVAHERAAFLNANAAAAAIAFDVPLLLEKGGSSGVDVVIVVSAPADIQRTRVLARPGMTAAKLDSILTRQMPDAEKRARADHFVDTGLPLAETRAQVAGVVACILGNEGQYSAAHA